MRDSDYMQLALTQARLSQESVPCGVVIVHHDQVIAKSYNSHHADHDATAHAEIKAIQEAGHHLGNKNLVNCTVYCTCEPCTMCASALFYAQVARIVYGVSMAEVDPTNSRIMLTIEELASKIANPPTIEGGVSHAECISLYERSLNEN